MKECKFVQRFAAARLLAKLRTARQRAAVAIMLRRLTPSRCYRLLEYDHIIDNIARTGQYFTHYHDNLTELQKLGCTNIKELIKMLKLLKKAWYGIVEIGIEEPDNSGKMSVNFRQF